MMLKKSAHVTRWNYPSDFRLGTRLLVEGFDEHALENRSYATLFMKLVAGKVLQMATVMVTSLRLYSKTAGA